MVTGTLDVDELGFMLTVESLPLTALARSRLGEPGVLTIGLFIIAWLSGVTGAAIVVGVAASSMIGPPLGEITDTGVLRNMLG